MTSATFSPTDGKLLAVDTSTAIGSVALAEISQARVHFLDQILWQKKAMHSEVASLEVERLLKKNATALKDLTCFAVNIGPGSFTGLRVGINLVRSLAYAFEKPVATFTSLEVLAFGQAQEGETVSVAIKAVQNYFYAASFKRSNQRMQTLVEPHSTEREEFLTGAPGKILIEGESPAFQVSTSAQNLIEMIAGASFFSWKDVKPLYVRASEAEEKLKKGILKPH